MTQINPSMPVIGTSNATEDPKILTALQQLVAAVNAVDSTNVTDGSLVVDDLQAALLDKLGASSASTVRRGRVNIPGAETTSATTYAIGNLTTPDRVQNLVLPTDGLIVVGYQAIWQDSVANAGKAAIFLGANQVKYATGTGAPVVLEASGPSQVNDDAPLATSTASGLVGGGGVGNTTEVTTGQILGVGLTDFGVVHLFAAAGTYDVSVQFKATSGSVTVKNRHLWVWTMGF